MLKRCIGLAVGAVLILGLTPVLPAQAASVICYVVKPAPPTVNKRYDMQTGRVLDVTVISIGEISCSGRTSIIINHILTVNGAQWSSCGKQEFNSRISCVASGWADCTVYPGSSPCKAGDAFHGITSGSYAPDPEKRWQKVPIGPKKSDCAFFAPVCGFRHERGDVPKFEVIL